MQTHEIIQREKERLALIGSSKDPAMFQSMRRFVRDRRTMNRSVIVNYADEDTRFGCRFRCKFCSWRERAIDAGDIYPTKERLAEFLEGFAGYKVTISGGGDPLYLLQRNAKRLKQLVDWIHELGFLVEVVTKETSSVRNLLNYSPLVAGYHAAACDAVRAIDAFSLSYESHSTGIVKEVQDITKHRLVRVSKVCTPGFSKRNRQFPNGEWDFIGQYCAAMRGAGAYQVVLREDFYDPNVTEKDAESIARAVKLGNGSVRWLPNKTCSDNLFLIGEETFIGDAALGGKKE
jgi:hypothetical protein